MPNPKNFNTYINLYISPNKINYINYFNINFYINLFIPKKNIFKN